VTTDEIGQYLEEFDFDYFLDKAIEKVPEGVDTREGSIIYDALAPSCYQMADFIMQLKNVLLETFVQTASGDYLDLRAEEHGLSRIQATQAVVLGKFTNDTGDPYLALETGWRFSSVGDEPIYYTVQETTAAEGYYKLQAEKTGTVGNEYVGTLLPVDHLNGLGTAEIVEITVPARDAEEDDVLRARILATQQVTAFGGNIEDYINLTTGIDGVGACQIYPTWDGGGTVRVVIVNNSYDIPSQSLISSVQEVISPTVTQEGYGLAPIGHMVTVAAPTKREVNVSMHVDIEGGQSVDLFKASIESALTDFFLALRKAWSDHDDLYRYSQTVYRSQLISKILTIDGILNVSDLLLNGSDADVPLALDNSTQELAFLGVVTYV